MHETTRWADGAVPFASDSPDRIRRLIDAMKAAQGLKGGPPDEFDVERELRRLHDEDSSDTTFDVLSPPTVPDHGNLLRKQAEEIDEPARPMNRKQRRAMARTGGRRG